MRTNPQTEAQLKKADDDRRKANLLPEGEYDAEVGTAEDTTSQAGNEMIVVDLTVFGGDGSKHYVKDYLMEKMAYKLRHASEACGVLDKYEADNLMADDLIGKSCKVKLKIDDKSKDFPPKNVVVDYIVVGGSKSQKAKVAKEQATAAKELEGEEIPF